MDLSHMPTYVPGFRDENNLRDLGGMPAMDSRVMTRGLVFRSGALGNLNKVELNNLRNLHLRYVLDLRTAVEARRNPDPNIPGVRQVRVCGATDAAGHEINMSPLGFIRLAMHPRRRDPDKQPNRVASVAGLYASVAFDNPAYRELFKQLEAGNVPLLFHCSQGKDRTGIAAMLVLAALGYDEDVIVDRYVLTNEYRRESLSHAIDGHRVIMSRLPILRLIVQFAEGVIREFGERVFEEIHQQYGTLEAYFQAEFGLDAERLAALRDFYLHEPGEAPTAQGRPRPRPKHARAVADRAGGTVEPSPSEVKS